MAFSKCASFLLIGTALLLLTTRTSYADDDSGEKNKKDNMEHIFPLLFLLGGSPTIHCPAVALLGMLSFGLAVFFGKDYLKFKIAWNWRSMQKRWILKQYHRTLTLTLMLVMLSCWFMQHMPLLKMKFITRNLWQKVHGDYTVRKKKIHIASLLRIIITYSYSWHFCTPFRLAPCTNELSNQVMWKYFC